MKYESEQRKISHGVDNCPPLSVAGNGSMLFSPSVLQQRKNLLSTTGASSLAFAV
jgi:hypothetical protein